MRWGEWFMNAEYVGSCWVKRRGAWLGEAVASPWVDGVGKVGACAASPFTEKACAGASAPPPLTVGAGNVGPSPVGITGLPPLVNADRSGPAWKLVRRSRS